MSDVQKAIIEHLIDSAASDDVLVDIFTKSSNALSLIDPSIVVKLSAARPAVFLKTKDALLPLGKTWSIVFGNRKQLKENCLDEAYTYFDNLIDEGAAKNPQVLTWMLYTLRDCTQVISTGK